MTATTRSSTRATLSGERRAHDGAGRGAVEQVRLPLPYDDEGDEPVQFALTARARRAVAPEALPTLTVVDSPSADAGHHDPDDRCDTRPARARAMARAGMQPEAIARALRVDELLVRGWVGQPGTVTTGASSEVLVGSPWRQGSSTTLAARRRMVARRQAGHLLEDANFARGIGMIAGIASVDAFAVTLSTLDEHVASAVVRWMRRWLPDLEGRLRVVVRVDPGVAADVVRHHWAQLLKVDIDDVAVARSRLGRQKASGHDASHHDRSLVRQVMIRVTGTSLAATLAGWLDACVARDTAQDGPTVDAGVPRDLTVAPGSTSMDVAT